jgi:hypothetical protein
MLDLAGFDPSDFRQLGVSEHAFAEIIDKPGVQARLRKCLTSRHDTSFIRVDNIKNCISNDIYVSMAADMKGSSRA